LNACNSAAFASQLAQRVDVVIGLQDKVPDAHAMAFSVTFYQAVFRLESIQAAFEFACSATPILTGHELAPVLHVRPAVDASAVFLAVTEPHQTNTDGADIHADRHLFIVALLPVLVFVASITIASFAGASQPILIGLIAGLAVFVAISRRAWKST
jgi:hypothetical protein